VCSSDLILLRSLPGRPTAGHQVRGIRAPVSMRFDLSETK